MHPKKFISKNVTEICTFFTFTYVRQTCFACNFFLCIFLQLFQRTRNQREILRFLMSFLKKKNLGSYQHFLQTFKPNAQKTAQKIKKPNFVNVSQISILYPSQGLYSSFSKKKSNSLYPTVHGFSRDVCPEFPQVNSMSSDFILRDVCL